MTPRTNDARRWAGHAFERVHRLLRPVFLDEPDDPVERDDDQDDGGVLEVADGRGDRGGTEQDQDHRVGELLGQQAPGGLGGALLELVRPVRDQTTPSLVGIEAQVRIGAEGGDDLRSVDRPWVPDAVDRGDVLDLDARGSADAWEHAHVASFRFVAPGVVGVTSAGTIPSVNAATRSAEVPIGPIGGIGHPKSGGPALGRRCRTTVASGSDRLRPRLRTGPAIPRRPDGRP